LDYSSTFAISAAGMTLERTRVEVAALNLANAHTAQAAGQAAYQPMRVVARAAAEGSFAEHLAGNSPAALRPQVSVEPADVAPRRAHEPGHPQADENGLVSYPGVDPAVEMMTLLSATRSYEANVAAMNMARALALKALDIGGNS
jgi:flagellar basal-body rod protein FlgC